MGVCRIDVSFRFEDRQSAVFGEKGASVEDSIPFVGRFRHGGLLQRFQAVPEFQQARAQKAAGERFDDFSFARRLQSGVRNQRQHLFQVVRIAEV